MIGRLWVKQIKHNKIVYDLTVPCDRDDPMEAMRQALHDMDLSQPVWLERHEKDWAQYALTRFLPAHFVDAVPFDRLEIDFIAPDEEKKQKRPRSYDDDD